jgi:hypothetical protein
MGASTKVSDWKVQMVGEITAGNATTWCFRFKSADAKYSNQFIFVGTGGGLGGIVAAGSEKYSSLEGQRPFSADDLDLALGSAVAAGVGVILGAGAVIISARTLFSGQLFSDQRIAGVTLAVGVKLGSIHIGLWKRI